MSGRLGHSPAEIIAELMRRADPASPYTYYDTTEPTGDDEVVTIYDTQGLSDGRAMVDGELWNHWGIQARIRSSEYRDGWLKSNYIRTFWSEGVNQAIVTMPDDGSRYLVWCIAHIGEVIDIGKNVPATKRNLFTINATTPIRELTAPP